MNADDPLLWQARYAQLMERRAQIDAEIDVLEKCTILVAFDVVADLVKAGRVHSFQHLWVLYAILWRTATLCDP